MGRDKNFAFLVEETDDAGWPTGLFFCEACDIRVGRKTTAYKHAQQHLHGGLAHSGQSDPVAPASGAAAGGEDEADGDAEHDEEMHEAGERGADAGVGLGARAAAAPIACEP